MRNEAIILMMASTIVAVLFWASTSEAFGQEPVATVIAAFDNHDSSGEAAARTAEHAAHVEGFAGLIGARLAERGSYRVLSVDCPEPPCSVENMTPDSLIRAAREAGGRLLIYGGIHKMSTLVQHGVIHVVDLKEERLLLERSFSFRGDNDAAFRHAAGFVARYVDDVAPKS